MTWYPNIQDQTPYGKNIVVYDLEIKATIGGAVRWVDYDLMGISVGVAFHYLTGEYHVFMDDNLEELPALLNQAEIVSGFNILGFDNNLVNASTKTKLKTLENNYDLLLESRMASGWRPGSLMPKSMRLNDHLSSTFGPEFVKTGDGAEAPLLWQRGELGKLVSYCVADVKRECMLFEHVWAERPVKTPLHGEKILRHPTRRRRGL